jgi:hypothetical protein
MSIGPRRPELVVTGQDSLAKLVVAKNGIPRDVHVVVKNTPFNVHLAFVSNYAKSLNERIDFSRCTVSVDVHYDSDVPMEGKKVSLLTSKPCEYRVHLSDKKIDETILEVRMKVLTSQHEDMLFRLHITVADEVHKQNYLTASAAIKVVSKPDQVRRINGEKGKKRTHSDVLGEVLERIEQRQQQQHDILMKLLVGSGSSAPSQPSVPLTPAPCPDFSESLDLSIPEGESKPKEQKSEDISFEESFNVCLKKFSMVPHEEKPAKIRKLIGASSTRDSLQISEFLDMVAVEGFGRQLVSGEPHSVKQEPVAEYAPQPSSFADFPLSTSVPLSSSLCDSLTTSEGPLGGQFYQEMMQYALGPEFFSS